MIKHKRWLLVGVVVIAALSVALWLNWSRMQQFFFRPTASSVEEGVSGNDQDVEVVAQNLSIPWEIVFLPDGDMLVTERSGTLKRIGKNGRTYKIDGVEHTSEGGLLGMALHPSFGSNHLVYLYLTTKSGEGLINRVESYKLQNDILNKEEVVSSNIPGAAYHDGGRIAFGPDKLLYVTTGDSGKPELAQDKGSLAGKILRLKDDGGIPADNPFGTAVYSYGHRNPQGLAWDSKGRLWATEHGRSGIKSGLDELNLITKGANYGWPQIEGDEKISGMQNPAIHSDANDTWAPAGMAFWDGSLFFAGLRGEALYEAKIRGRRVVQIKAHFKGKFGRLRGVVLGPDQQLYISTSNTDGRGRVKANDDKIIKINPRIFRD